MMHKHGTSTVHYYVAVSNMLCIFSVFAKIKKKHRYLYSPMGEEHMGMQCVRSTQGALAVLSEGLCVRRTLNHLLLALIRHQSIVSYKRLKSHKSNRYLK